MKRLFVMAILLAVVLPAQAAEKVDPKFAAFWNSFREAVMKKDKEAVVDRTRLPFLIGDKALDRAAFLKEFDGLFGPIRPKMAKAEVTKEKNGYFVFCGEQILIFEKGGGGYQFTEIGVTD